jgi:uncharacterized protein
MLAVTLDWNQTPTRFVTLGMKAIAISWAALLVACVVRPIPANSQAPEATGSKSAATSSQCSAQDRNCNETWEGERRTPEGRSQSIELHVAFRAPLKNASVALPDFGALDIPASKFSMGSGTVHFELVGDTSTAIFDGIIAGDAIHGTWKEGDRFGKFDLKRAPATHGAFHEENVSFLDGDVHLAGTLLTPSQSSHTPAIVFVQGAGPETRSASRFLAEFFVRRGVAALIYDKRGAGASSGDWQHSSFEDLAADVTAAVRFLKSRSEIDPNRIGLMGSSQGGWIAPMAAVKMPGLAFVIAKSAAPMTPEDQELGRVERQMRAEGDSPADITEALSLYRHAIAYARTGDGWESLPQEISADSKQKWTMFDADTPRDFWFFDQIRLNFFHDPIPVLTQVKSPLLVIFGGEDEDAPPLQSSLNRLLEAMHSGGKDSELEIFPSAGHDLRVEAGKGQAWDFPRFAPGYLSSLADWVKLHTQQ